MNTKTQIRLGLTQWLLRVLMTLLINNCEVKRGDRWMRDQWRNYLQMTVNRPYQWQVNISSGDGLVLSGLNHYLSRCWPILIWYCVTRLQWLNDDVSQYRYMWGLRYIMMTSSNGNIFRVTGHFCGEFTGPRWIPHTKASVAELWSFLWSAPE